MNETKQSRPFGLWQSEFQPSSLSQELRLNDVQWTTDGRCLIWLEGRSDRGVLVCQDPPSTAQRDLTRELSVRAGVGYGGGEFATGHDSVYFVSGGMLYHQPLHGTPPSALTPAWGDVASVAPSPDERFLLYIHSSGGKDVLALVDIETRDWPQRLVQGHDFYMQPCWRPDGKEIAWVCWNHPNMPWDGTAIMRGLVQSDQHGAALVQSQVQAGDPDGEIAYFQPLFSPDGSLLAYVSDEGGWFNLQVVSAETGDLVARVVEEAEHAPPAWVQGLRSFDWTGDGKYIYFIRSRDSFDRLARLDVSSGQVDEIGGEVTRYTTLYQPGVSPATGEVGLLASAPDIPIRVITTDHSGQVEICRRSSPEILSSEHFSAPDALSWETEGSEQCHGLFYQPQNPRFSSPGLPPLLIKVHGGPTSQYRVEYDPETQFFTSRGYAVLALNYRGSSGYGREYRRSLRGEWGVKDHQDVSSAADYLSRLACIDSDRIVISGGSAGGFTVLSCLVRYPGRFKAGICRYGVSDLMALTREIHKFEAHYLDSLVGDLVTSRQRYKERSPVFLADRIQDPVAIFQGDEDRVVPRSQSDIIVESLERRGVPHLYKVFTGEGHGWKKQSTIETYYRKVDEFLARYLVL